MQRFDLQITSDKKSEVQSVDKVRARARAFLFVKVIHIAVDFFVALSQ